MARMKRNAIRRPSPVLMTPREMKNAQSTSQTMRVGVAAERLRRRQRAGDRDGGDAEEHHRAGRDRPDDRADDGAEEDREQPPRLGVIPSGTGSEEDPATVATTTPQRRTRSRGVSDSSAGAGRPALAEGSAVGGLSGGADEGGAGVTVIGGEYAPVRRARARVSSPAKRYPLGATRADELRAGSDPDLRELRPRRATLRGQGVSTSRRQSRPDFRAESE